MLEPEVWPDERPRGSFGAGRQTPPEAGTPGSSALRSEGLRTVAPGSVSPGLTDMSTLRKQRHFNLVATRKRTSCRATIETPNRGRARQHSPEPPHLGRRGQ